MRPGTVLIGAAGAVLAAALWWRKNPSACPYGQRFWVEAPHPFITRPRLREILEPRAGERLLEEPLRGAFRSNGRHPRLHDRADLAIRPPSGHWILPSVAVHADVPPEAIRDVRSSASSEARRAAEPYRIRALTVPSGMPRVSAISVCDRSK